MFAREGLPDFKVWALSFRVYLDDYESPVKTTSFLLLSSEKTKLSSLFLQMFFPKRKVSNPLEWRHFKLGSSCCDFKFCASFIAKVTKNCLLKLVAAWNPFVCRCSKSLAVVSSSASSKKATEFAPDFILT